VVAHPRGNSVPVSSDDNDSDEDDRPLKKRPARSRWDLRFFLRLLPVLLTNILLTRISINFGFSSIV
jgi:hypothetical protein